jgi:hypothetical protein
LLCGLLLCKAPDSVPWRTSECYELYEPNNCPSVTGVVFPATDDRPLCYYTVYRAAVVTTCDGGLRPGVSLSMKPSKNVNRGFYHHHDQTQSHMNSSVDHFLLP